MQIDRQYVRNVLILMDDSLSEGNRMGGLSEHIHHLVKGFSTDYFFIIIGKNTQEEEYFYEGENFYYYEPPRSFFKYTSVDEMKDDNGVVKQLVFDQIEQYHFITNKLWDYNIDIVHCCDWSTAIVGYYASKFFSAKLLVAFHLSFSGNDRDSYFRDFGNGNIRGAYYDVSTMCMVEDMVIKNCHAITYVSTDYHNKISKYIDAESGVITEIIPNGIEIEPFLQNYDDGNQFDFSQYGEIVGDDVKKVLFIGRFSSQKGLGELLYSHIPENIHLIIAGDLTRGGENELYELVRIENHRNPKVTYVGKVFGENKYKLFKSVDAIIMPSRHEPFGIVALEALASKKILITSNVNGMSDFLEKGSYIPCRVSPNSIENAFRKFSSLSVDDEIKMKTRGHRIARKYSWQVTRDKYFELYNKLI